MTDRLLHTAKREAGESLLGYILRLSDLNYYDTPARITSLAGLPRLSAAAHFISSNKVDLTTLASLSDTSVEELHRRVYYPAKHSSTGCRTVFFFDHQVHHDAIRSQHAKVCPMCLTEFGFCRAVWDLLTVTCCPIHACLLLRNCPQCDTRISWNRKHLCVCVC